MDRGLSTLDRSIHTLLQVNIKQTSLNVVKALVCLNHTMKIIILTLWPLWLCKLNPRVRLINNKPRELGEQLTLLLKWLLKWKITALVRPLFFYCNLISQVEDNYPYKAPLPTGNMISHFKQFTIVFYTDDISLWMAL